MDSQQYHRVISYLLGLYILSLAFTDLWLLPGLSRKLQLAEVLFSFMFLLSIPIWQSIPKYLFQIRIIDIGLLALLLAVVFTAFLLPGQPAYLEVLGLGYLWLLYWIFSRYMVWKEENLKILLNAIWGLGSFIVIISACSVYLTYMDLVPEGCLAQWKLVPYLGKVIRVSGLTFSPNLWATTIEFSILILVGTLAVRDKKNYCYLLVSLLCVALLMTFSKSIVAFIAVLGLTLPGYISFNRRYRKVLIGMGASLLFIYLFISHVLILSKLDPNYDILKEETYISQRSLLHYHSFEVVPSTYTELKRQAIRAFQHSNGMGVGSGQFIAFLRTQQEERLYPSSLPLYEPHSTYFGLLAEEGLLGGGALILAITAILKAVIHISKLGVTGIDGALFWGAKTYLLLMMIEALVVDVLNFRTLWVALGIIGAIYIKYENQINHRG